MTSLDISSSNSDVGKKVINFKDVPFSAQRLGIERRSTAVDVRRTMLTRTLALSFFRRLELGMLRSLDGERGSSRRSGGDCCVAWYGQCRARAAYRGDAVSERRPG